MAKHDKILIPLLPNEHWWGGIVRHGDQMPFGARTNYRARLYQNLYGNQGCPLLVSSKGRYLWSEEPFTFTFEEGLLTIEDMLGVVEQGEGHENLRGAFLAACQKFFPPSGRMPDELCFLSSQFNSWIDVRKKPTQEKILAYARSILDAGLPPGVFIIDDFWYKNNGVWEWDFDAFPKPKEIIDFLHKQGFLVMLWISPWVTADTRQYAWLWEKGYLLTSEWEPLEDDKEWPTESDMPVVQQWWNGYSAVLDLSNPDTFAWLQRELDKLVDEYRVDGFKFDGGDPYRYMPTDRSYAPRTPNGHCEDFARIGLKYDLSEYRACWKLGGQHLLQRVRDKAHLWGVGGLADTIPTSLCHGLVGYPYTLPDMVGGGEITYAVDEVDQELFIRWAQCATFFPIIQYSLLPNRVLDNEHLSICMDAIKLRTDLGPTILELAKHAAKTGEPIMRHMAYVFPDEGFEMVNDQYMLGDEILVAPVLNQGQYARNARFPSGRWQGDDGSFVEGPCEIEISAPLTRVPWYTKLA
ncbi:MAG: glycoside hydrolase [Chloroflexi bacterium]|nr:glycoside hydrolase [Chloroflexota bacterium]